MNQLFSASKLRYICKCKKEIELCCPFANIKKQGLGSVGYIKLMFEFKI